MSTAPPLFYQGRQVAILTQHGKQDLVRGPLEAALGCQLVHTDGYDTDQLGTFTRELTRAGSQLDAARKKSRDRHGTDRHFFGLGKRRLVWARPLWGLHALEHRSRVVGRSLVRD